jgi:signal transduction histidine kinase
MPEHNDAELDRERLLTLLELGRSSAEHERRRLARILHDTTLQSLAAAQLTLSAARGSDDHAKLGSTIDDVVEQLTGEIDHLRAVIADLRPSVLVERGLLPALEALAARFSAEGGLAVELDADLGHEAGRAPTRLEPETETAIYRAAEAAIATAATRGGIATVRVALAESDSHVSLVASSSDGAATAGAERETVRLEFPAVHRGAAQPPPDGA